MKSQLNQMRPLKHSEPGPLPDLNNLVQMSLCSHAVGTERTILSPFTKEYRVLAAWGGIRQFLKGLSFPGKRPKIPVKSFQLIAIPDECPA
ncbi:hypothetical protein QQP08_005685 [Theobroma cacao]|nr:hypothetical protein QQP08_005685 [Theobroma cacao]